MKKFLAPILLLTLLFPSIALGETMDDLVVREGLYYKKFTDVPFTGKVTGNTQGVFRNGKKHGPWSVTTRMVSYGEKVSSRTVRKKVVGSITGKTELCLII